MHLAMAAGADAGAVLLGLAVILFSAKLGGEIFERLGQPVVLGELLAGVVLGNLGLLGIPFFGFLRDSPTLTVLAEIGIVILLFEVGVHSTVPQMLRTGGTSLLVAIIGVAIPAALGFFVARAFFPDQSVYVHLFVGAILSATSVGITARVLKDAGHAKGPEAQVILGAAVIDDILGLILLATVSGMILAANSGRTMSVLGILWISGKALGFLAVAIAIGMWLSRRMFRLAARLRSDGVLLTLCLGFCFVLAYLSKLAGLAPIVGAFTAGLILEDWQFKELVRREGRTLEDLLKPITSLLLPVFFVLMGLKVDLSAILQPSVLAFAAVLVVVAAAGKIACAFGVLRREVDRWAVGIGMIPRGEVGLIFAGVGMTLLLDGKPVVSPEIFSGAVIMVMATTLLTPPLLAWRLGAPAASAEAAKEVV